MVSKPRRSASMAWAKAMRSFWVPGRVAAVELEVELPQTGLALDVARAGEVGVADLGVDDVLVGLEALVEAAPTVACDRQFGFQLRRQL